MKFWRRRRSAHRQEENGTRFNMGWNACIDKIEEILGEHAWVIEEEDRQEIFCDTCGESLPRKLKQLRRAE